MSNVDQYEQILSFLETQTPIKKGSPAPKVVLHKKERASIDTKKLIESSKIHADIPGKSHMASSKGFDVNAFETMMRAKLIDSHKKIQSYERPYISVTELCGCLRQAFYSRSKYPIDLKKLFNFSYLYLIQAVGNTIHSTILNLYNFSETEKTVVSEKYKVKGRIDGLRKRFLHEIKSIDEGKFKGNYLQEHYNQAVCYAHILNTEYDGYDIDTVVLIYIIRNCKRIYPFDVPVKTETAEYLLQKAPIILSSIRSKIAPDPLDATMEQCTYCLYRKYCEQDVCSKAIQPFAKTQKSEKNKKPIPEKKKPVFLM